MGRFRRGSGEISGKGDGDGAAQPAESGDQRLDRSGHRLGSRWVVHLHDRYETPQCGLGLPCGAARERECLRGQVGPAVTDPAGGLDGYHDGGEVVRADVVQLTGQPFPFRLGGLRLLLPGTGQQLRRGLPLPQPVPTAGAESGHQQKRADASEPVGEKKTADAVPCGRLQELDDGDSRGRAQADGPAAQNGDGEQRHHDRRPRYQAQQVGWRQDLSHHGHRDDDAQGGERCPVTPIERHHSERRGTEGGDPLNGVRRLLRRRNDAEPQQQLRSHEQYRQWPDPTSFPHWRKCMAGRRPPRHRGVQGVTRCRPCGRATALCPAD